MGQGMGEQTWLDQVRHHRVIAVIRAPQLELGYQMAQAAVAGGLRLIEITWTSDRPVALVQRLRAELPQCWIGAGTVLDSTALSEAIAAGAQFVFSPHTDSALVQRGRSHGVPMIPGALTPSEIVAAWQAGAAAVKVFPVQTLGGAAYLQQLQAPLGHIPLIPTGGVTIPMAAALLQAGALGVGLSGQLFPAAAIAAQRWSDIRDRSQACVQALRPFMVPSMAPETAEDNRPAQGYDPAEFRSRG
jgi:2-dehydro-3-deoxyphosphogluconate aldolase/(4S)-4-hydroxy-2-oxoglutarate aldolase